MFIYTMVYYASIKKNEESLWDNLEWVPGYNVHWKKKTSAKDYL